MNVIGKVYTKCMYCGREDNREYTPMESFKQFLYMPGYIMMECETCKARHAHYHVEASEADAREADARLENFYVSML